MMADISELLLQQRVRNRIIEHFDGAASFDKIAEWGAFEEINLWEDWVQYPLDAAFFSGPVFSEPELKAIEGFHSIWNDTADATTEDTFSVDKLLGSEHWKVYVSAAKSNFELFMQRGRFSDDEEAF